MPILTLVHPAHGNIGVRMFQEAQDSKKVLRCLEMWRHSYGVKFLQCICEWDCDVKRTSHFVSLLKQHYDIFD